MTPRNTPTRPAPQTLRRMERARAALRNGSLRIQPHPEGGYLADSQGRRYHVTCRDGAWSCTCVDHTVNRQVCKHIIAVRLGQPAPGEHPPLSLEETMHPPAATLPASAWDPLSLLRQPPSTDAAELSGHEVIAIANRIFEFRWSFELLGAPQVLRWQRQVRRASSTLPPTFPPMLEEAGLVLVSGQVRVSLDGRTYTHADAGHAGFNGDAPADLQAAISAATADCLTRCFRQLGEHFGSHAQITPPPATGDEPPPPLELDEPLLYRNNTPVDRSNPSEVEAFLAFSGAHAGLTPATREALRHWAVSRSRITQPAAAEVK